MTLLKLFSNYYITIERQKNEVLIFVDLIQYLYCTLLNYLKKKLVNQKLLKEYYKKVILLNLIFLIKN